MRMFDRRPGYRKIPDDAFIISPEESEVIRQIACPKCGRTDGLFYAGSIYEVGRATDVYRCCNETRGKVCGQMIYNPYSRPDILWVSDNGMWAIQNEGISHTGAVNLQVMEDGMYSNRYTMYADGTVLRDHAQTPGYVDDQVRRILDDMRTGRQ